MSITSPEAGNLLSAKFRDRQRAWLAKLGILDRPWLIFGAAPSPTIPAGILETHARVDINNSGITAQALGLGRADLTFRKKSKSWAEHPSLDTRGLIWYRSAPVAMMRLELMMKPRVRVSHLMRGGREERDAIVEAVSGAAIGEIGRGKATNGVAAACYALFVGIPEIVLCGISLSQNGHSYNEKGKTRLQLDEDALVLSRIKDFPNLFTTEENLARQAGIRLWHDRSEGHDPARP